MSSSVLSRFLMAFFAAALAATSAYARTERTLNPLCLEKYLRHLTARRATLADTDPAVINLPEYKVLEPDANPWHHQVVGSPEYIENQALGRSFLVNGSLQWNDTLLTAPPASHVQLTEISFVYEQELRGKNGELLDGWGKLMAVSKTQDFNTGQNGEGKYAWAESNPISPLLHAARESYYQGLKDGGYSDAKIAEIRARDESLPLTGSRYYVVSVDGKPKGLLRIFGGKNNYTNPHEIVVGTPQKPINPDLDKTPLEPIKVEVGNAFGDASDGSGIRYADFLEYGWLKFIQTQLADSRRPMSIHATASRAGQRLYTHRFKFQLSKDPLSPGYVHLEMDPKKFIEENTARIMGLINQFRASVGITKPYEDPPRLNYQ